MNTDANDLSVLLRSYFHSVADDRPAEGALRQVVADTANLRPRRWPFLDVPRLPVAFSWVVLGALLALLLALAVAVGSRPPPPLPTGASNGFIVMALDGQLQGELDGASDEVHVSDLIRVRNGDTERWIGKAGDEIHQTCPRFSADGTQFVYLEAFWRGGRASALRPQATEWNFEIVQISRAAEIVGAYGPIPIPVPSEVRTGSAPCPEWSPDGHRLAYADSAGLHVITLSEGGGLSRLVLAESYNVGTRIAGDFDWSPDGSRIAYLTGFSGQPLWLVSDDGSQQQVVAATSGDEYLLSVDWSPDGRRIALGGVVGSPLPGVDPVSSFVRTISSDTLALDHADDGWASSGGQDLAWGHASQLAYVRGSDVVVIDESGNRTTVFSGGDIDDGDDRIDDVAPVVELIWSPDGRRLMFVGIRSDGWYAPISVAADGTGEPIVEAPWTGVLYPAIEGELAWQPILP